MDPIKGTEQKKFSLEIALKCEKKIGENTMVKQYANELKEITTYSQYSIY